jgi:hypothetical protein
MAKTSGLGWTTLTVQDAAGSAQDLRDDITNLNFSTPRGVQDVTGIDVSAHQRLLLLADFTAQLNGVFDPASNEQHDVFKTISSTSVVRTLAIAVAGALMSVNTYLTDYQLTRSNTGEFTWQVPASLADGAVPTWTGV